MKIEYQGMMMDAVEVDFFTRKEDFSEYQLEDGTVIKMKTVAVAIHRIDGVVDEDGYPVYNVQSTNFVRIKK